MKPWGIWSPIAVQTGLPFSADLEIDHIVPYARGSGNSPDNLRLLCRKHNVQQAGKVYGGAFVEDRVRGKR